MLKSLIIFVVSLVFTVVYSFFAAPFLVGLFESSYYWFGWAFFVLSGLVVSCFAGLCERVLS